MDRLDALARPDKWYLGAGEGVIWAPPFPAHLDRPGFWDEGHVFHFPVAPLFTVALVDARGREIGLRAADRRWRPDRLTVRWEAVGAAGQGMAPDAAARPVALVEERAVLPGARFGSIWHPGDDGWAHPSLAGAWLAAFTQIPAAELADPDGAGSGGAAPAPPGPVAGRPAGLGWRRRVTQREHLATTLGFDLVAGGPGVAEAVRRRAVRSEGRASPRWALTPFPELWGARPWDDGGGLDGDLSLPGQPGGWVHLAVAVPLGALAADAPVSFTLGVRTPGYLPEADDPAERGAAPPGPAASIDPAGRPPRPASPGGGEEGWRAYLDGYPRLRCSDPFLERYWDYRIYGLRLNRVAPGPAGYPHPAIAEGIGYFHWPISYSAQCHMLEARWGDGAAARGSLLNFLAAQRDDGSLPGRLHLCPDAPPEPDFYHAGWGDAVLAVEALHPAEPFRREAYDGLSRYARWLMTARDPEGSGMVTVTNHYETGQEYMSRYVAVDPAADTGEWEPRLALKGIDVTVYLHRLQRALAVLARRLGEEDEAGRWEEAAAASSHAILDRMWDPETGIFSDVDAGTMTRTGVRAAVCFYPLLTDLLGDEHVDRLLAHLDDPGGFRTEWPVPSSAVSDPLYSPDGLWRGKRHNCPWNGRVWPMTNSHVIDGLLRQWRAGRRQVGPVAADLLRRFVRMMFDDQDPDRPNCFEHYSPETAHPSRFRGIDDYQHSWVLDLLARGAAGLDPDGWLGGAHGAGDDGAPGDGVGPFLVVDPLPLGLESLDLEGAMIRGRTVDVRIRGESLAVTVDGDTHRGTVGEPLVVPAPGRRP